MHEVPPGPERDALVRFFEESAAQLEGLRDHTPFPVVGLREPRLQPGWLGEVSLSGQRLTEVGLAFGDPVVSEGPSVIVRSTLIPPPATFEAELLIDEFDVPPDLADALADERDRVEDYAGRDRPRPDHPPTGQTSQADRADQESQTGRADQADQVDGGPTDRSQAQERDAVLDLGGQPLPVRLRVEDQLWAAAGRIELPGTGTLWVSVVSRGVPADAVHLEVVPGLGPFLDARPRVLAELVDALPAEPEPQTLDLPPARGFDAHRALIEVTLADVHELRTRFRPRRQHAEDPAHWEAAVRAQMRLATEDRPTALAAVTSLVNHVIRLSEQPWFDDQRLASAAVEETLRWVVFDSDVPSRRAQQAWVAWWRMQCTPPPVDRADDPSAEPSARPAAQPYVYSLDREAPELVWQQVWDAWAARHGWQRRD